MGGQPAALGLEIGSDISFPAAPAADQSSITASGGGGQFIVSTNYKTPEKFNPPKFLDHHHRWEKWLREATTAISIGAPRPGGDNLVAILVTRPFELSLIHI